VTAGALSLADAFARERQHIHARLAGAPIRRQPSPHAYVESLFSLDFYERILANFPRSDDAFRRWLHGGDPALFFGNYDRRLEINLPQDAERFTAAQREFWSGMEAMLCSDWFAELLIVTFNDHVVERFGPAVNDPSFARTRLRGAMMLNKHDPDYYLGPHTDRFEKVFTCVFYLPERAGLDALGTALYEPKERGFTCRGVVHHDPAKFVKVGTIPFRPNSAFVFARSDVLFHGVERLTAADLHGSARPGFQVQFWER
jgi:hypothetical protein